MAFPMFLHIIFVNRQVAENVRQADYVPIDRFRQNLLHPFLYVGGTFLKSKVFTCGYFYFSVTKSAYRHSIF
jgi:hypothetical protein